MQKNQKLNCAQSCSLGQQMALFCYFKREPNNHCSSLLTKPAGPLSADVPAASIVHVAVNKEMKRVQQGDTQGKKCGQYDYSVQRKKCRLASELQSTA